MNAMWLIDKHYVDVHYKAKKGSESISLFVK